MILFPRSKINLGLSVVSKREDGYHNLESVFYPVPFFDALEIIEKDKLGMSLEGVALPGNSEDNICMKAYRMLAQDFDLPPVHIYLLKRIPPCTGLGGGSSNGTHTLLILNDLFSLKLSIDELQRYASRLGADCSFFLYPKAMFVSGKGEILSPIELSLKGYYIALCFPDTVRIKTPETFQKLKKFSPAGEIEKIIRQPIETWKEAGLKNDFEEVIFEEHPALQKVKEELYQAGANYASMSGTGSCVYGIFKDEPKALEIENSQVVVLPIEE